MIQAAPVLKELLIYTHQLKFNFSFIIKVDYVLYQMI